MRSSFGTLAALAAGILPLVAAQTFTACNPMKDACSANPALKDSPFTSDFTKSDLTGWNTTAGKVPAGSANGAEFTLAKKGDAPTIQSETYIFFGYVEVKMKAAPGTGVVSSIVLQSDDLDEVDWEFLGGNNGQVQTNYFGKGNTATYDRMIPYNVADVQGTVHTYAVNWTSEKIDWVIDTNVVRTLNYADAQGGKYFPQTPMNVRIGIWAGGDPGNSQGTIEWAGGVTPYDKAPFNMYVESVSITNYSPGSEYTYGDKTGSYQSIQVKDGTADTGAGSASGSAGNSDSSSASPSSSTTAAPAPATDKPAGASPAAGASASADKPASADASSVSTTSAQAGKQISGTATATVPTGDSSANGTADASQPSSTADSGLGGIIMSGLNGPGAAATTPAASSGSFGGVAANGSTLLSAIASATGARNGTNGTASSSSFAALQTTNGASRSGAGFAGVIVLGCMVALL